MAQLPADRTKLALAQSNQVPSAVASSQRNKDAITEAYDTVDKLYELVNTLTNSGVISDKLSKERVEFSDLEYKGYNYLSYSNTGYLDISKITAAKITGANTLAIVPIRQMATGTSNTISNIVITNASVQQAVINAKAAGFKVVLKPHVDCTDGTFRGDIAPADWAAWFANYQAYILEFAAMAQTYGADMFVIGTELRTATMSARRANWATLVNAVKAVYTGKLSYCALCSSEGEEFANACIWDMSLGSPLVDYAGVSIYFPMTNKNEPTVDEIIEAWSKNKDGKNIVQIISSWQKTHKLPVIFGEVGCSRIMGANQSPGKAPNLYPGYPSVTESAIEQNNYAEALMKVWTTAATWFKGVFWWNFHTDVAPNADSDYFNVYNRSVKDIFLKQFNYKTLDTLDGKLLTSPTKNLSIGVKLGGADLMDLVTEKKIRGMQTTGASGLYWSKVGELILTSQSVSVQSLISIMNGDHGATSADNSLNTRGLLFIRVRQQNALGNAPIVQLTLLGATNGIINTEIVAVTTVNDATKTVIGVFIKNKGASDAQLINELHGDSQNGERIIWRNYDIMPALPAGTQTTAEYAEGKFKTLQQGGYDVLTDNSFALQTYVKADMSGVLALGVATYTRLFDLASTDQLAEWSNVNKQFTALKKGLYHIDAIMRLDAQTTGSVSALRIAVDRSGVVTYPFATTETSSNGGITTLKISGTLRLLNVGDKIFIEGYNSLGANVSQNSSTVVIARVS